jgi:hypothetical protein
MPIGLFRTTDQSVQVEYDKVSIPIPQSTYEKNGYRSSLAKQKAGAKNIAEALNRTPRYDNGKALMHMLDGSFSTRGNWQRSRQISSNLPHLN